jgi:hypothetical protein
MPREAQKKWEAIQNDLKNGGPGNWPSTYYFNPPQK